MSQSGLLPDVRKIAVLRANALGDFMFVLPALEALRSAYPNAEIALLGLAWHAAFLAGRPSAVDRVEVVPPTPGVGRPEQAGDTEAPRAERERFFRRMVAQRFDLALQLHGGGRYSNPFTRRLGAGVSAGLRTPDAAPLDRWTPYVYWQHEVLRYLEAVALVGARPVTLRPGVVVTAADREEALARLGPWAGRPPVVLHPGAGDGRRRWPPERFARVGNALAEHGLPVAVTGTVAERALVDGVRGRLRQPGPDLCDRLSLGGLAGLLAGAALVISNDSGPLHLAVAVGAPTVGIYWGGNFAIAAPLFRARHRAAISHRLRCARCGADAISAPCDHPDSFVADVPAEQVLCLALGLLGRTRAEPARIAADAAAER